MKNGINPSEEPIPLNIIEYALKNSLEDYKYRNWIKTSSPNEIKTDIVNQNQIIRSYLNKRYTSSSAKFDNNELIYLMELKKLFLNDYQYFEFLKFNYPNKLNLYGKNIFSIIKDKQNGYGYNRHNHVKFDEIQTMKNAYQAPHKDYKKIVNYVKEADKSGMKKEKKDIKTVTVYSEYMGNNHTQSHIPRRVINKVKATEYKSSIPKITKHVIKQIPKVISKSIKRNNYSLEPKVIRRSYQILPRNATVKNIIEQRVSQKPKRVLSVSRIKPLESRYISRISKSREDQGFGEWKVIK